MIMKKAFTLAEGRLVLLHKQTLIVTKAQALIPVTT